MGWWAGVWALPMMDYIYGEAPPEIKGVPLSWLEVYKRVGVSQVEA